MKNTYTYNKTFNINNTSTQLMKNTYTYNKTFNINKINISKNIFIHYCVGNKCYLNIANNNIFTGSQPMPNPPAKYCLVIVLVLVLGFCDDLDLRSLRLFLRSMRTSIDDLHFSHEVHLHFEIPLTCLSLVSLQQIQVFQFNFRATKPKTTI